MFWKKRTGNFFSENRSWNLKKYFCRIKNRGWQRTGSILSLLYTFVRSWLLALIRFKFFRTTTFRLTFLNLCVFTSLSVAVFLIVYISLAIRLHNQMDKDLLGTLKEAAVIYRDQGMTALQEEFNREAGTQGTGSVFFRLFSSSGTILASSDLSKWQEAGFSIPNQPAAQGNQPNYRTAYLHEHKQEKAHEEHERSVKVRLISMPVGGGEVIQVGNSLSREDFILDRYRETFGFALMVMVGCGGFFSFLLARKAMAGVQKVTDTATNIGRNDLGRRVPLTYEGEEINALAHAFNAMLERIEILITEIRQVTDNVAHELRTPITRIRGMAETTLKGTDDIFEYKEMAASVIEGSDELIEMIGTMLELAKTDSGTIELEPVPLDVVELVEEAVDLFMPMAEDKGIDILLDNPSITVTIIGDRRRLQRVVSNLLDNAIKYTPGGGVITVTIKIESETVNVTIADTGIGISDNDLPRIFERFYRGDKSRSTTGNGLGLSLALAVIQAHRGSITVKSSNHGSTFTFFLPAFSSQPNS